ncbi:MAG: hypothetical protein ACLGH8_08435 [Bacteroidia bacterium]|jgi:hypothetical protein
MPAKKVSAKIVTATSKIANIGDVLLQDEGHDWEVDAIHLTSKSGTSIDSVVCKYELKNGKWVLVCRKV